MMKWVKKNLIYNETKSNQRKKQPNKLSRYRATGTWQNGKKYVSNKTFKSRLLAMNWAMNNLVYNKSGNTKRRNQLTNINAKQI